MNVNATLDGESVTIVSMEEQRLTAFVTYIDAQGGPGNLKITEVPLTDLPLILATGSEAVPSAPPWPLVSTTFDPVNISTRAVLSGGNLVAHCGDGTPGGFGTARSIGTIAENTKTIFEFTHTADTWIPVEDAYCVLGFGTPDHLLDGAPNVGQDTYSLAIQSDGLVLYNNQGIPGYDENIGVGFVGVGDTITFELERSGVDTTVLFYKNGSYMGIRTLEMPSGVWHAMVSSYLFLFTATITANFLGPYQIEPKAGYGPIPV
jgi:hypothetical protein